jgi:septal ring factor EnvC (AmiA/AmiB activator)
LRSEFEATIQAEREEAARKQEQLQAQLRAQQVTIQANQAALEQNQNLLRQTQKDMKGMQSKFEETNALLRAMLNLQRDGAGRST